MSNMPGGEPSGSDANGGNPQPFTQEIKHQPVSARIPQEVGRGVFCTAAMVMHTPQEFVLDFMATLVQPYQIVARVVMTPLTFSRLIVAMRENLDRYNKQFGPQTAASTASISANRPSPTGSSEAPSSGVQAAASSSAEPRDVPARDAPTESNPTVGATGNTGSIDVSSGGVNPAPASGAAPPQPNVSELYEQLRLPDEMLGGTYANVAMIRHTAEEFAIDFIANFYPRSAVTARIFLAAARVPTLVNTFANAYEKYEQKLKRPPESGPDSPQA